MHSLECWNHSSFRQFETVAWNNNFVVAYPAYGVLKLVQIFDFLLGPTVEMDFKRERACGSDTAMSGEILSNVISRSCGLFSNLAGKDEGS